MRRLLPLLLLALFACSPGGGGESDTLPGGAPNFILPGLDGQVTRLSDFHGKVVLLDFWATWCPPCRQEIPELARLHREYAARGVVVLGIALDREGLAVVAPFARDNDIPYPVLLGDRTVTDALGGVENIPTLFVVDREGRLVKKLEGYHSMEKLERMVKPYL